MAKDNWMKKQLDYARNKFKQDTEELAYTAQEGSTLDRIWKGTYNKSNMSNKKTEKVFDVPVGFPIPLNRAVILEKHIPEAKVGGIILTEGAEDNNVAILMAVGEGCDPKLKPGQKVMYNVFEKRTILFEMNNYLIMHENALFCILPEQAILMVESVPANQKRKQEKLVNEQKRVLANARKDANDLDKGLEINKKKYLKRK